MEVLGRAASQMLADLPPPRSRISCIKPHLSRWQSLSGELSAAALQRPGSGPAPGDPLTAAVASARQVIRPSRPCHLPTTSTCFSPRLGATSRTRCGRGGGICPAWWTPSTGQVPTPPAAGKSVRATPPCRTPPQLNPSAPLTAASPSFRAAPRYCRFALPLRTGARLRAAQERAACAREGGCAGAGCRHAQWGA